MEFFLVYSCCAVNVTHVVGPRWNVWRGVAEGGRERERELHLPWLADKIQIPSVLSTFLGGHKLTIGNNFFFASQAR